MSCPLWSVAPSHLFARRKAWGAETEGGPWGLAAARGADEWRMENGKGIETVDVGGEAESGRRHGLVVILACLTPYVGTVIHDARPYYAVAANTNSKLSLPRPRARANQEACRGRSREGPL